jgi:hypothetical protein
MDAVHRVRLGIYTAIVRSGDPPGAAALAATLGLHDAEVADAYRTLAEAHVIVLRAGTLDIAWAPPFSVVPTSFRTVCDDASWYAPCAWDAFGIPAALKRDAVVDAGCAWSGDAIRCGVANGRAYGDGLIHLLVPAAHFWDDIAYT